MRTPSQKLNAYLRQKGPEISASVRQTVDEQKDALDRDLSPETREVTEKILADLKTMSRK